MTDYEYILHDNKPIMVDSAIRDGDGYRISTTYPKKVDIEVTPSTSTKVLCIDHGLQNKPSAVSLYVKRKTGNTYYYEKIGADIITTDTAIQITFAELPEGIDGGAPTLLVRSLI